MFKKKSIFDKSNQSHGVPRSYIIGITIGVLLISGLLLFYSWRNNADTIVPPSESAVPISLDESNAFKVEARVEYGGGYTDWQVVGPIADIKLGDCNEQLFGSFPHLIKTGNIINLTNEKHELRLKGFRGGVVYYCFRATNGQQYIYKPYEKEFILDDE